MDFVGFTWLCNFGAPEMLFGLAAMSDTSSHAGANVTWVYYFFPLLLFAQWGELSLPGWPGCAQIADAPTQPSLLTLSTWLSENASPLRSNWGAGGVQPGEQGAQGDHLILTAP